MSRLKVYGALVLVQVFFGVHYFAAKRILGELEPRAWAAIRVLGAAALLMGWNLAFLRRHPRSAGEYGRLALFAIFGVGLNQVLFVEGLSRTTPSHSAIINSLIPVLTLGFAVIARVEHATPRRLAALAVSLASVLVLLRVESFRFQDRLVQGDLMTLANATSFSLFLVMSKGYLARRDPMASTAWLLVFGAVGIGLFGARSLAAVPWDAVSAATIGWGIYAIVCATALAYFLNYYALRYVESSMVALFIYLQAPIATALSVLFLGERLTLRFGIAAFGIFVGIFLAVRGAPPPRVGRPPAAA